MNPTWATWQPFFIVVGLGSLGKGDEKWLSSKEIYDAIYPFIENIIVFGVEVT